MNEYSKQIARNAAAYAHTGWFSKRWAILPSDRYTLVLADNNPVADGRDFRHGVFAKLTAWLEDQGCALAATASYPEGGESDGYTLAQVYHVGPDGIDDEEVSEAWSQFWISEANATAE